ERLDHGELERAIARREQRLHPVRRAGELEATGELDHLQLRGAVLAAQGLEHFAGVRLRQPGGGCLHEILDPLVVELGDPAHERRQRFGAELLEQLGQLLLGGVHRRLVERLQQLRQRVALRQAAGQPLQRLAMLRDDLARALQDGPRFAENVGDGAEVAGAQQIGDEVLDDRNQLGADRPVCLQLEQVEEHREDVATQVLGVLAIDILLEVLDLAVFQEIEGGIEVVDRYQALALGRSLLLHAVLDLRGRRRRDRLALLDRDRVLRGELAERVRHELEVLRPQQREQVVRGVGLEVACLLQHTQEPHDLGLFHARPEGDGADSVLEQRPGDALVALVLAVDDVVLPAQLRLPDVEHQIVRRLPDLAERGADVVDRTLVHGIVRQIELRGPDPLGQDLHQLFDLLRRQRHLGYGRVRQRVAPVSSATMATSLSPRPLTFSTTRSPARNLPRRPSTHATAWALSSAGTMPSRRESAANASSACRSVTASYN